jgi:microcystin-dependent protein
MVDAYTGEIRLFAGGYAPEGWLACNGALLSIQTYAPLYSLIGTIYGGDGQTTFALPDLRGRVPIGQGQGPGLTPRTIGGQSGSETVTLTLAQLPSHNHTVNATSAAASTQTPGPTVNLAATTAPAAFYLTKLPSPEKPALLNDATVGKVGGISGSANTNPHENMMMTFALTYIICTNGLFPTRN